MPKRALLYISAVTALGTLVLGWALAMGNATVDPFFAACLILGAAVAAHKIELPGMDGTISGGFAFILLAIGRMGWEQTVVMAAVTALVQSLWRTRQTPLQVAFNVANLIVCSWFAHMGAHALVADDSAIAAQLCVASLLLYFANTFLVSVVVCLVNHGSLARLWDNCRFWAFPYYLAGGLLSSAIIASSGNTMLWVNLTIAPAIIVVASYYRQYLARA
jgi:hypothetical protein